MGSLFAGVAGQHFYPKEQTVVLWATVFLSLRVYVEERRTQGHTVTGECDWDKSVFLESRAAVAPVPVQGQGKAANVT